MALEQPDGRPLGYDEVHVIVDDPAMMRLFGLSLTEGEQTVNNSIPSQFVSALQSPYPPAKQWTVDSDEAQSYWSAKWGGKKLHDDRTNEGERRPFHHVDQSKLVTVKANISGRFYDEIGQLALEAGRNVFPDPFRKFLGHVSLQALKERKNVRLDHPGSMVLLGYIAGAQKDRMVRSL